MNDKTVLQKLMWDMMGKRDEARDAINRHEIEIRRHSSIINNAKNEIEALDEAIALFNAVVPGLDKPRPEPIGAAEMSASQSAQFAAADAWTMAMQQSAMQSTQVTGRLSGSQQSLPPNVAGALSELSPQELAAMVNAPQSTSLFKKWLGGGGVT